MGDVGTWSWGLRFKIEKSTAAIVAVPMAVTALASGFGCVRRQPQCTAYVAAPKSKSCSELTGAATGGRRGSRCRFSLAVATARRGFRLFTKLWMEVWFQLRFSDRHSQQNNVSGT